MQYILLLYSDSDLGPQYGTPDFEEQMKEWFAYTEALTASGAMLGGEALADTDAATSVRVRDGQRITTDGPFAETKEVLGGYYVIDVENLDEALDWAAKIPNVTYGTVEVRPIMTFEQ